MFQFFRRSSSDAKRQKVEESPSRSAEDVAEESQNAASAQNDANTMHTEAMEIDPKPPQTLDAATTTNPDTPEDLEARAKAKVGTESAVLHAELTVSAVTSSSVTLRWTCTADDNKDVDAAAMEGCESIESHYRVRYYRAQFKTDVWRYSDPVQQVSEVVINGLERDTMYIFQLQVATSSPSPATTSLTSRLTSSLASSSSVPTHTVAVDEDDDEDENGDDGDDGKSDSKGKGKAKALRLKWASTRNVQARTWGKEKEERVGNLLRVHQFLMGNLEDYPEEQHVPDTYLDKAARSFEGILSVAGMVGAGGKWIKIARDGWKMRQYGLAALIFRQDLQRIMVTLGTHVGRLAEEMGLSNKELILGSYYYFWERKRERLIYPDIEHMVHAEGEAGVINSEAPIDLIESLAFYLPFARLPYRKTPSEIQWIVKGGVGRSPESNNFADLRLVCFRNSSKKTKPSFSLFADEASKAAILAIRGTKEFDDVLTSTRFKSTTLRLHRDGPVHFVHEGMYESARWLYDGSGTDVASLIDLTKETNADGAGMATAIQRFADAGYSLTIVGHSLGAGVAVILGLIVAQQLKVHINIFGFGTPCCVDKRLAEAMKGEYTSITDPLLSRVTVVNLVNRDDIVSRLSLTNCKRFAAEINIHKDRWEPFVNQDKEAISRKAMSLWAPNQRTRPVNLVRTSADAQTNTTTDSDTGPTLSNQWTSEVPNENTNRRLYIPGQIVHAYQHRGTTRAALADHNLSSFQRIQAFDNMIDDHRVENLAEALRGVIAARNAPERPPAWESIADEQHVNSEYVRCNVCQYFVGWDCQFSGHSEAVELRNSYHCYRCGKISCSHCSKNRRTIPQVRGYL